MAVDMDARDITLNYTGGSVTMAVGNAKDIFGEDFAGLDPGPVETQVTVKSHSRVRVIGEPATNVAGYNYTYAQWPTSTASNAAAGTVIYMTWTDSEGDFTGRVSGSMSALATFFTANVKKALSFRTQRGKKYGPFAATT
jgi:hypothetical protein